MVNYWLCKQQPHPSLRPSLPTLRQPPQVMGPQAETSTQTILSQDACYLLLFGTLLDKVRSVSLFLRASWI